MARPIYEIANEIERKWAKVNYAARPYLDAMKEVTNIGDATFQIHGRGHAVAGLEPAANRVLAVGVEVDESWRHHQSPDVDHTIPFKGLR